jgi:hypothetical protein
MITVGNADLSTALVDSLTNDLFDVAHLAVEFAEPENAEAARAALAAWSPSRLARALAEGIVAGA